MATEEQIMNTNRLSSLTYMISACLEFSIQNLNRQLDLCNLRLVGRDKMVMKDEDARLAYEDATHIYWALFMTLVDRGGTDNLCDLRFKALIDIIGKYESILHLPGLDTAYHCAFAQVSKAIQEGKYSKEDFKNLLKVHENRTEETKG